MMDDGKEAMVVVMLRRSCWGRRDNIFIQPSWMMMTRWWCIFMKEGIVIKRLCAVSHPYKNLTREEI